MFGIGFTELLVVLVVALLVIGPDKLPAVARTIGKAFVEFRRVGEDLKKTITDIDLDTGLEGKPKVPAGKKTAASKKSVNANAAATSGARSGGRSSKKVG